MTESPKKSENLEKSKKSVKKSLDCWENLLIDQETDAQIKDDVKRDPFTTMIFVLGIIAVIGFIGFGYWGYSIGAYDMAVNTCRYNGADLNESTYNRAQMSFECTKTIGVMVKNDKQPLFIE